MVTIETHTDMRYCKSGTVRETSIVLNLYMVYQYLFSTNITNNVLSPYTYESFYKNEGILAICFEKKNTTIFYLFLFKSQLRKN